jgi:phage FluMu gp28-like protein
MKQAPYALLPYQQKWLADKCEVKLFTKSRRIGISWAEAADSALTASSAAGMNVTYICYDKDITRQFIKDCADWAKAYDLAASEIDERIEIFQHDDEDKSILIYRIYFASGFEIEAIAGTPRKLRGRKGRVIIDEAAFLDDLGSVIEATLALLIWGGDVRIITTYNGMENAYYELEQDVLAGKFPYSRHFVTFQDAISQGLYERICLVQNRGYSPKTEAEFVTKIYAQFGDRASQELDCIPAMSGGAYLPRVIIEQCMDKAIPVIKLSLKDDFAAKTGFDREAEIDDWLNLNIKPWLDFVCQSNLKSYFGFDFARVGDLSVLLPIQEREDLTRIALFGLEMRNVPYEQQRQILFYIVDRLPRFMAGALDKGGNGGYLAEVALQRYGLSRIHAIQLSQPWYGENFPKYKSALEDRKVLMPLSSDWLDDHRMVVMDKGIPKVPDKKSKGTDGMQRHGDSAIAGVLAWFASLNGGGVFDFDVVETKDEYADFNSEFSWRGF